MIEAAGADLLFLSFWSLNFNAIENAASKLQCAQSRKTADGRAWTAFEAM